MSPASTSTTSSSLRSVRVDHRQVAIELVGVDVSAWPACRCASCAARPACALPRPSATASAKLANSTVNHSQAAIWPENQACAVVGDKIAHEQQGDERPRRPRSRRSPGSWPAARGSSLRKASSARGADDRGRRTGSALAACATDMGTHSLSIRTSCRRASGSARRSGPSDRAGKILQAADDHDHADEQADEQRPVGREGAGRRPGSSSSPRASRRCASTGTT